jgi:cytochrome oxidase Cu insertion factor (SCO1/SenC/PrrC family)
MPTRVRLLVVGGVVVLAIAALVAGYLLTLPAPLKVTGSQANRPVPDITLTDQSGSPFVLSDLHGKVVVIYPFLTDCHELCPLTTAAFIQMQEAITAAGLQDRVALLEVTVDPARDTPARLAAYAKLTSADWTMLTGSADNIAAFWKFFGVFSEQTPVGSPAPIDWYTNQPETYDVTHTPALIFLDARGHERVVVVGTAQIAASAMPSQLEAMLNATGQDNLAHPSEPWTVQQALDNVSILLGRPRIAAP